MNTITKRMIGQFGHPRGFGGRLAGWVMAHRSSNRQRNLWVVSLLDVQPTDRVLEVGFGPGIAIAALSPLAGRVYGIDHSAVMVRAASRRNAAAIRAQRVRLIQASSEQLPAFDEPLDAVLSVNSLAFWPDAVVRLAELRAVLRPGGRIAIASQPRVPGSAQGEAAGQEIANLLGEAGFTEMRVEILPLEPPVVCVLARSSPGAG